MFCDFWFVVLFGVVGNFVFICWFGVCLWCVCIDWFGFDVEFFCNGCLCIGVCFWKNWYNVWFDCWICFWDGCDWCCGVGCFD